MIQKVATFCRFSLHSSKIDALIELPAEIKQSTKIKHTKIELNMKHTLALIQSAIPQRNLSKQLPFHSFLTKSYESGTY